FIGVTAQAEAPATLPALFDQLLIVREAGSGTREILTTWLAAHNAQLSDFRQTLALSSPTAIIELLKQGVGISFMYRALVANELARGDLFELPLAGFPLEHPLNLIYLKESSFAAEFGPLVATAREMLGN
ncbi:LysR family transcriptional regulator, partial [Lactobacillus reuteri]